MSETRTVAASPVVRSPSSQSLDKARFVPGTMLADRYRIVALLGRGGMGEVYRAEDLTLGQPVALKFLPGEVAKDPHRLARFRQEVRVARQVSHPNVCRVYDIGDADGQPFISMEYVSGEDLASLLRRIGRLPTTKATELARQICAGLAAAHDRGVLHRDLKPANVMIDERGRARIADFGLAGLADDEGDHERGAIAGTPGYMAPEQFSGRGTSTRSDVYALGLILYELFTGQPAHAIVKAGGRPDFARPDPPANPSTIVTDIDPAVERVILRCLENDPARRPSSAIAVASALPGGDPLAAVLAAGETPSPEMVAAAADTDRVSMRTIGICVVTIAVGLVIAAILGGLTNPLEQTPSEQPPAALEQKARELIRTFGYEEPSVDRGYGLYYDATRRWLRANQSPAVSRGLLANGQPAGIVFWYRESPRYLEAFNGVGELSVTNPPMVISGMITVQLDPQGRLVQFDAVPQQVEEPRSEPPSAPDWTPLLTAARLDMTRFAPALPSWSPLTAFDARASWTGSFSHSPEVPVRIEAAAWRGRPVYFQVIGPWSRPERIQPQRETAGQLRAQTVAGMVSVIVIGIAALFAWRHFHQGRGDVRGASRAGAVLFGCSLLTWVCTANHVPNAFAELTSFSWAISTAAYWGGGFWVLYVALEPHVRRRWPQSIISWSRLLAGDVRHPLVGGHLLTGVAVGVAFTVLFQVDSLLQGIGYATLQLNSVVDGPRMASILFSQVISSSQLGMGFFFAFFLLRVLLRRPWLAAVVLIVVSTLPTVLASPRPAVIIPPNLAVYGLSIFTLSRFGVLPIIVGIFVSALPAFPLTTNLSTWYAGSTLFALASVLALTAFALFTALDRRSIVGEGFLERA